MYALVEIKGRQYKAEKGSVLRVDLFSEDKGTSLEFDSVLLLAKDADVKVGTPYVKGAKVKAVVTDHTKGDKVMVYKYKRRKSYHKMIGHRQKYTLIKVEDIIGA